MICRVTQVTLSTRGEGMRPGTGRQRQPVSQGRGGHCLLTEGSRSAVLCGGSSQPLCPVWFTADLERRHRKLHCAQDRLQHTRPRSASLALQARRNGRPSRGPQAGRLQAWLPAVRPAAPLVGRGRDGAAVCLVPAARCRVSGAHVRQASPRLSPAEGGRGQCSP